MNKLLSIEQSYVGTWKNRNKMEQWGRISWILCPKSNLFLITAIADTAMNNKWVANLSAFHVNLCDFVQKYRISKLNIHIFWFGYQMAEKSSLYYACMDLWVWECLDCVNFSYCIILLQNPESTFQTIQSTDVHYKMIHFEIQVLTQATNANIWI